MDKKDLNENLENNSTTEETNSTTEESNSTIPVMNKVGSSTIVTPPAPPATSKGSKGWMIASAVLAVALIVVLVKPPFQKDDSTIAVATVNGSKITKEQLYDKLIEAGGESTLQSMITTELVDQEAKKDNVTVTDEDLKTELADLKAQFGGEEAFNSALQQSQMTEADLMKQMPLQVKLRKILEPKVTVTDKDIQEYYDANKATFKQEEEVSASHILVKTKEEADAIYKQLKDGADFATLAKEKSSDTGSKDKGGELGYFKRGDMVAEFSDAAFKLKVGETSEPVKSEYGYHIIKVADHKEAKEFTLAEKKEEIKKMLISQKVSTLSSTWLSETTAKAKITNTLTDAKKDAEATPAPSASAKADNSSAK